MPRGQEIALSLITTMDLMFPNNNKFRVIEFPLYAHCHLHSYQCVSHAVVDLFSLRTKKINPARPETMKLLRRLLKRRNYLSFLVLGEFSWLAWWEGKFAWSVFVYKISEVMSASETLWANDFWKSILKMSPFCSCMVFIFRYKNQPKPRNFPCKYRASGKKSNIIYVEESAYEFHFSTMAAYQIPLYWQSTMV